MLKVILVVAGIFALAYASIQVWDWTKPTCNSGTTAVYQYGWKCLQGYAP